MIVFQVNAEMSLELLNVIGKGSHGVVYHGRWQKREVAIKQIRRSQDMQKIHHEMELIKKINCKHIVNYYDIIMEPEYAYVVMELIEGNNTYDIIKSAKNFPIFTKGFMKSCSLTLARSLECIHRHGYLYNDMKPSNIMLDISTGEMKLVDLGSVIPAPKGSVLQHPLGTPYFFSPEKLTWNYDTPADVWALGITLYEYACGHHPFLPSNIRDLSELEYLIMEAPIQFQDDSWEYYGDTLQHLIKSMLQRDPRKRITIPEIYDHPWLEDVSKT